MREIEFRCWDVDCKIMCRVYQLEWKGDTLWADCIPHYPQGNTRRVLNTKLHPLMEFTGLYDKNGTKVFEGDILQSVSEMVLLKTGKPTGNISIRNYLVEHTTDYAMFNLIKLGDTYAGSNTLRKKYLSMWYIVLGNRYANEELLC